MRYALQTRGSHMCVSDTQHECKNKKISEIAGFERICPPPAGIADTENRYKLISYVKMCGQHDGSHGFSKFARACELQAKLLECRCQTGRIPRATGDGRLRRVTAVRSVRPYITCRELYLSGTRSSRTDLFMAGIIIILIFN